MAVYIYALRCPESGSIRYIGKSIRPQRRLSAHISAAMNNAYQHHTSRWIRKLSFSGLIPSIEILETIPAGECWREAERRWIAHGFKNGWPLTNSTMGGEGLDYVRQEDKDRYREKLRSSLKAYQATEDGKNNLRKFLQAANTESVIKKRTESIVKSAKRPEFREKMRAINSEINARQCVRDKKSVATCESWKKLEVRERRMDGLSNKKVKQVQSDKRKKAWADPVLGAKLREIHNSPEVRAKKSESAKNRATPEYRAMMAEKTRLAWVERRKSANKEEK